MPGSDHSGPRGTQTGAMLIELSRLSRRNRLKMGLLFAAIGVWAVAQIRFPETTVTAARAALNIGLLIGLPFLVWWAVLSDRSAAVALAVGAVDRSPRPGERITGGLEAWDAEIRRLSEGLTVQWLGSLTAADLRLLSRDDTRALQRALGRSNEALVLAILAAIERSHDQTAVVSVRRLAARHRPAAGEPDAILVAAQRCLEVLSGRQDG